METWTDSKILYDGTVIRLRVGEVTLDNGVRAHREVVEHNGGVCVIPFTGHSVFLVRQFRIAVGDYVLEAPAGKIEGDEEPGHRAALELEEETGHKAGRMIYVGFVYGAIGFCSEKIHLYLAFDLERTQKNLDPEERIELLEMPFTEVERSLREHAFLDAKTMVGLQALLYHLERETRGSNTSKS